MTDIDPFDTAVDDAVDRLFSIISRTRFRSPGTSPDPYLDSLILWVSVVNEVREVLAPLGLPSSPLREVEYIYRESIESWLRGDEPTSPVTDDPVTARVLSDEELQGRLRQAIDPPPVWMV